MTRDELKQAIVAEVVRALRELGLASDSPGAARTAAASLDPPEAPPSEPPLGVGLVVLSGFDAPAPALCDALDAIAKQGGQAQALLSFTYRLTQAARAQRLPGGIAPIANPDDEAAFHDLAPRMAWTLVPDVSMNTLAKSVLGIEDSAPTRAIAAAFRLGKPCLFVESAKPTSPAAGTERHNLLRQIQSARGALLTDLAGAPTLLRETLYPSKEKPYRAPAPRPSVRHPVVTKEDVYEAFAKGLKELAVPADAIVTMEATEDAVRRGMTIRRNENAE